MERTPIKKPKNQNKTGNSVPEKDTSALNFSVVGLLLISALQLVLFFYIGYFPLYLAGLAQLMPALICLILLVPASAKSAGNTAAQKQSPESDRRNIVVSVLICLAIALTHILFWTGKPSLMNVNFGYFIPVLLGALFVIGMILDRWCKYSADSATAYEAALLKNVRSALAYSRMILLVVIVAVMLNLLKLYDAANIMRWIIGLLFVYGTVFLVFSLVVRLIRHELSTEPKFIIVMPGISDSDLSFIPYLEENTGISMRSLWSIRMIKQMIPAAVACVALVIWLSTGIVQIDSQQEGALYRLGKLQSTSLKPGFHLTLPWPLDRTEVYDTQSLGTVTIGYVPSGNQDNFWTEAHGTNEYRLLLGGGDEMVSINLRIEYRIKDLLEYVRCSSEPVSLLQAAAYEIVTARTITTDLDTLLSTDREVFSKTFREDLTNHLSTYSTGLEVVNVNLESIHPPVEVAAIYQDIISAGIEAERMVLAAQTEANTKIMNAENEYTTAVGAALVTKYQSVAAAEAAVAEFMASVAADGSYSDAYRYYKYMDALTKAYSNAQLILVGEDIDTANLYIGSVNVFDTQEPSEE